MKSIILSFLLLCLFPFVAFSRPSTTFISDNPIVLPTTTHDDNLVLPPVRDADGDPLKYGEEYLIGGARIGVGYVYWADIDGDGICPNAVVESLSIPSQIGKKTPVKFSSLEEGVVELRVAISTNIMFINQKSVQCDNETVWKVDDKKFVVTGGTLGNGRDVFKIMKYVPQIRGFEHAYYFKHCPHQGLCEDVGGLNTNGHLRLEINANGPLPFVFHKRKFYA